MIPQPLKLILRSISLLVLAACQPSLEDYPVKTLFTILPDDYTGIDFANTLEYNKDFNIYTYRNFYNGGGVAMGDLNNDGLLDVYLTANMQPNKLYLNRGNFQFEDVTEQTGVQGERAWSTGVSIADVNGDSWLDIYVCNSGDIEGDNKQNELYINNGTDAEGNLSFTESAEVYGLADQGYSTHAAFFDYDKDGDLDMYLLNNSYQAIGSFNLRKNERPKRDPVGGDKLFRNDTPLSPLKGGPRGVFVDVSEAAGIYGSIIGFGLGVTVGDINKDGWQDIYVSNDFFERDYIYINNQDGTFTEDLENEMRSISGASMGADMADINNDGYADIFVTEMLPADETRLKTKTTFENWDRYQYNVKNGYYHQFTRNMLQLNTPLQSPFEGGRGMTRGMFSEIGRLAGVHATDWSWGALMADFDNDGQKDIFVANGIYQDLTDQDFIQYISNEQTVKAMMTRDKVDFQKLIDAIPSERIANYMFANNGDYTFTNQATDWGMDAPSHSNGSAYGDLDNDGDLDLIVNNVNMPAFVYRNNADTLLQNHFLKIKLVGEQRNPYALGAQVTVKADGQLFYQEQMPVRGFQSTMDHRMNMGLGKITQIDTLEVRWPNGQLTQLQNVAVDQMLTLYQKDGKSVTEDAVVTASPLLFEPVTEENPFVHQENKFVDFDRERLLFHMLSREGPHLAKGDVNNDGLEDLFVGGAKDQAGVLLLQNKKGQMIPREQTVFKQDSVSEDTDALFFDADQDGDLDLYVASGGNELPTSSSALIDRLYFNDGTGQFVKSAQLLPTARFESTGAVAAADYDGDGDQDLFVGMRLRPFLYGVPVNGYILQNDGKGNFQNVTESVAPALKELGLITDATWEDIDGDQDADLMVVGEWMPIRVFKNDNGRLVESTEAAGLTHSNGWWNKIVAQDLDGDGDVDFVVGNHGLNSRFKASREEPLRLYVNDFDKNGTAEQIISAYNEHEAYPVVLKHDLVMQMPGLKKKYLKYASYQKQRVEDIFTPEQLEKAVKREVYELGNSVLINQGDGTFTLQRLPTEAQFSPVYGITVSDFDQDGHEDLVLGGNFYAAKPEVGRYDASYGLYLKGNGQGNFRPIKTKDSGLVLEGEVRDMTLVATPQGPRLWVARNNEALQAWQIQISPSAFQPH